MEEKSYRVNLEWTHDRRGILSSDVLPSQIEVATPPGFNKGVAGIWSPEHLFVAAVNSCFMTTFLSVAENSNLPFSTFSCKATGFLENDGIHWWITRVELQPTVTIPEKKAIVPTLNILKKTQRVCFISQSIKSEVVIMPKVQVIATAQ